MPSIPKLAVSDVRVLIADDYPDAAESLALFLSVAGCETRIAHDGEEALIHADAWRPHVCVLDLAMPRLDGLEVASRIRQLGWAHKCLLIAVTGWTAAEHSLNASQAGFDYCLRKPVDPAELARLICGKQGSGRLSAGEKKGVDPTGARDDGGEVRQVQHN